MLQLQQNFVPIMTMTRVKEHFVQNGVVVFFAGLEAVMGSTTILAILISRERAVIRPIKNYHYDPMETGLFVTTAV